MSATYEGMSPGGHETYATSIFSKIKTYLDSNPYTPYKGNLAGTISSNSPAVELQAYWDDINKIKLRSVNTAYNTSGTEYSFLLSKGVSNRYGTVLRWSYSTKYIEILRKAVNWLSTDWERINAGYADSAGNATTASKLGSSNIGSATQPIYLNAGTATACTYTLGKSVPSDAVFTDTKNTAGSTDTSSKIFLIGATSQAANPQTYSQDTAYVGTDGCLYSGGTKVLTAHQDISGKADKSATVSTVTWSNNKLTKTINGTTSDVVSAATILANLTSSQVTSALGYTPASVNTTYDFESSDNSISFMGRAVGSVETVDMTVNGKVSTEGDTISGDYINTADFIESGVTGKRVTTYGPWGIDIDEYVGTSLWSKLALRDSDILLTKTWDGTHDSLKATIAYLGSQSAVNKVDKAGDTMTGALIMSTANFAPASGKDSTLTAGTSKLYKNGLVISNPATANDQGWIRVLGTAESDTILEIATGDDGGTGEQIVARQYNTSNAVAHQVILLDTSGNFRCGNTTIYSSGSNGGRNSMLVGDDCKLGDCNVGGMLGLQAASGTNCGIRLYNSSGGLIGGFQSTNGTPQWINSSGTATTISLNGHGHSYLPLSGGTLTGATAMKDSNIFRTRLISRNDTGDSGYINFVNTANSAYAPVRSSNFTTMSCKHTKTNIVDISEEDALKLLDIRPVNFDYIEEVGGQKDQIGVLAEDTYEVLPKVVSVPDDYVEEDFDISKGIHQPLPSVDYAKFVPYLIKLVQMQQKEIDILKKERT